MGVREEERHKYRQNRRGFNCNKILKGMDDSNVSEIESRQQISLEVSLR